MNRLALLLMLMIAAAAQAEIYRWVDENGVTVYSEMPPPDGRADRIEIAPVPKGGEEDQRQLDAQMQKLDDYLEDKALAAQKKKEEELKRQIDEENCRKARNNLDNLIVSANRLVRMPDGSVVRLTEEQRQQQMQEARKLIDEYCKQE